MLCQDKLSIMPLYGISEHKLVTVGHLRNLSLKYGALVGWIYYGD